MKYFVRVSIAVLLFFVPPAAVISGDDGYRDGASPVEVDDDFVVGDPALNKEAESFAEEVDTAVSTVVDATGSEAADPVEAALDADPAGSAEEAVEEAEAEANALAATANAAEPAMPDTQQVTKTAEQVAAKTAAETPAVVAPSESSTAVSDAMATAKAKGESALNAVVESMRPQETVPPLDNDRFVFYLSDEITFAQFERSSSRYGFENGRAHLAFLHSEERDTVVHSGLALDAAFGRTVRLSVGARGYFALLGIEDMDTFAGAIGVEAAYKLPFKALPLELGASAYYSPDVLSFGASDRLIDFQVDVAIPFRSQLSVFAGIRYLQVDTRPGDREVDNRPHVGLRWDFK